MKADYFNCHVESALFEWKDSPLRKPILNYGARQVGKSSLIRKFGAEQYKSVTEINFMRDSNADNIFAEGMGAEKILESIQLYTGKPFSIEHDLLVFEEIGFSHKALTSLKFFTEEAPNVHLMTTGSNIGLYRSFPVGKVDWLSMFLMTLI